jgi:hypothetical protein
MRRSTPLVLVLLALLLPPGAIPAQETEAPGQPPPVPEEVTGMVAVPLPFTRMTGRVLQKDGVTPVRDAEVRLTSLLDGTLHTTRSRKDGRYRVDLPLGRYRLSIERRMEVFTSPSHYIIPWGTPVAMDFLLLPDFEEGAKPAAPSARDLPAPVAEAERVVGSIVDMAPAARPRRSWRWAETLGFLGTALAVAIAAD